MFADDPPTFPMVDSTQPQKPGRGRRRDDTLPYNRARDVQRAFRARRAEHLAQLETRVVELEEENAELREALSLPPAERQPLGQGPTGRGKPLLVHSRRSTTRSSSESNQMADIDDDLDDDLAEGDSPPFHEVSTTSITASAVSTQSPSPEGAPGSFQYLAQQAMRDYVPQQAAGDAAARPALESMPPNNRPYPPTYSPTTRDIPTHHSPHGRSSHQNHITSIHTSRPDSGRPAPLSPSTATGLATQPSAVPSQAVIPIGPRGVAAEGSGAANRSPGRARLSDSCLFTSPSVPSAQQTEVSANDYALPHHQYGHDAYRPVIKNEVVEDGALYSRGPRSDPRYPPAAPHPSLPYSQPRGAQPASGWAQPISSYPPHSSYISAQPYAAQSAVTASQPIGLSGWRAGSHPLQQHATHYSQQQNQYCDPRGP